MEEAAEPCCVARIDGSGLCVAGKTPCEKRNTTLFWDKSHISEAANEKIAMKVFNGSDVTSPVNIVEAINSGAAKPPTSETPPSAAHSGTRPSSVSYFNLLLLLAFSAVLSSSL